MAKPIKKHEVQFVITAKDTASKVFKGIWGALPSLETTALAAGAAIAAIGAASIAAVADFSKFETAVTDLGRVTDQDLDKLKNKILELPPELGKTTDLTKGLYNVISAGVTDPIKAFDFLTVAAKSAKSAHLELDTAVSGLSNVMDGFKGKIKDAADASDLLFTIERVGKTRFEELVPVIGQVTTSANLLGASVDDLGGLFATVTKTAGSTENAATQVKAIFASMLKPSAEMAKALKDIGGGGAEAAIQQKGLVGVLQELKKQVDSGKVSLTDLFANQRALIGIGPAIKDNFATLSANIAEMGTRAGASQKAFDAFSNTIEGSFQTLVASADRVLKEVVGIFAPEIGKALRGLADTITANKPAIVAFAENIKVKFSEAFKVIDDTLQGKKTVITDFVSDMGTSFESIIKITGSMTEAVAGIIPTMQDISEFVTKTFAPAILAAAETISTLTSITVGVFDTIAAEIEATGQKIAIANNDLGGQAAEAYLRGFVNWLIANRDYLTDQTITNFVGAINDQIRDKHLDGAKIFGANFTNDIATAIIAGKDKIRVVSGQLMKGSEEELKKAAVKAKTLSDDYVSRIASTIKAGAPKVQQATKEATDFADIWDTNTKVAESSGKVYTEAVSKAIADGASIIERGGITAVVWPAEEAPKAMEAAGIKGGSAFGSGTIDGFKTEEEHIKDTLNNITEDLFRRIDQTILDSANKSGKKTGEGIADGIKDSTPQTLKATSDMAEGVMKLLPHNSPAEQGPLSELDKVGPALIDTIAEGVKKSAKALETEVIRAFDVVFKELDNVTEAIENLPPVNIETKQSIKNLQNLSKALETLPETKDIFVNVQNNQALNEIQRVKDKLDSIPQVTTKQLVIQAKTQASPIMDFTKGVNYMDERLNKLVTPREMLIQADLPSRLSPADPRFTDVGRPQAKIKQDVAINVNVKVDKLDVGRHNIDMIAADIGRTIARDINNDRGDMPKAIRTVAMRV